MSRRSASQADRKQLLAFQQAQQSLRNNASSLSAALKGSVSGGGAASNSSAGNSPTGGGMADLPPPPFPMLDDNGAVLSRHSSAPVVKVPKAAAPAQEATKRLSDKIKAEKIDQLLREQKQTIARSASATIGASGAGGANSQCALMVRTNSIGGGIDNGAAPSPLMGLLARSDSASGGTLLARRTSANALKALDPNAAANIAEKVGAKRLRPANDWEEGSLSIQNTSACTPGGLERRESSASLMELQPKAIDEEEHARRLQRKQDMKLLARTHGNAMIGMSRRTPSSADVSPTTTQPGPPPPDAQLPSPTSDENSRSPHAAAERESEGACVGDQLKVAFEHFGNQHSNGCSPLSPRQGLAGTFPGTPVATGSLLGFSVPSASGGKSLMQRRMADFTFLAKETKETAEHLKRTNSFDNSATSGTPVGFHQEKASTVKAGGKAKRKE